MKDRYVPYPLRCRDGMLVEVKYLVLLAVHEQRHGMEHGVVCCRCRRVRPAFHGSLQGRESWCEECFAASQSSASISEMLRGEGVLA